jgi:hypothetical protein
VTIYALENFYGINILRPKNIMETFGNIWKPKICTFVPAEGLTRLEEDFTSIKKGVPPL